jgi:Fe-S cluster assembly iron-binding protein IscA
MSQEKISVDLFITDSAAHQIELMKTHDYTLKGQEFRIHIKGKGCHGFDYASGFSSPQSDDVFTYFEINSIKIPIIMDPFTAFYTQKLKVDYLLDPEQNTEGFIIENLDQDKFQGKFYKDTTLLPPWAKT